MPDWDCHANFHFLLSSETAVQVLRNKSYPYSRFNSVVFIHFCITERKSKKSIMIIRFQIAIKRYLKLTCHHINRRHISFNIESISVYPLLWIYVMLDFICMVFAELWSTESKRKIKKRWYMSPPGFEPATPRSPAWHSNHSSIGTYNKLILKLKQYFFAIRYYKNFVKCVKDI